MGTMERLGKKIPEQCCFECKDGGEGLRVCDYKNCLKSYHPKCTVRKEFPPPAEPFICNWHTCVDCRKSSDYQCLCCPHYSVCHNCLRKVKFFKVGKQNKGLCRFCIDLATSLEKNAADPQAKSNFQCLDTSMLLFKDYWNAIKVKEGLTLVDLQEANSFLDIGPNHTREVDAEKIPYEDHKSDEDLFGDSDNTSMKRKRSKRKTYVDWGTKELIEFLSNFGKDTNEPLDEAEVVGVVKEYIKQKNLFVGDNKKS